MDWDTYYEKFYDWATSTQISRMSSLTSFGSSSEVTEVAQAYMDEAAASRLIKKAVAYGVQFTSEEILELSGCCNASAMNTLLNTSKCKFNREQLAELWGAVDDDVLESVAARNHVDLFDDDEEEGEYAEAEGCEDALEPDTDKASYVDPNHASHRIGFFGKLALAFGMAGAAKLGGKQHPSRCTGDCANCPPHYGYRYGRWYYGHDHVHGCEFGGNKGSGGMV